MSAQPSLPLGRAGRAPDTLAPDGSEIRLLATTREGARTASLCEVRIPPGAVSRPVRHRSVEEIWHVTRGRGRVWRCPDGAEAVPVDVGPGDTLVVPPGVRFQFAAAADAELTFLCYTCPAWPGPDEAVPAEPGGLGAPTL
jgi:mannose-6-phosphate isomerase-like protein (cupin superfamily)